MIEDIIQIAREAGNIVKEGFGKNLQIEFKTNESNLVTIYDKKSEEHIINFIRKKYPAHGILAEEGGDVFTGDEYLWVIDPLDGTTNYAHGVPIFSVSIGVVKNKETVAGVIYDVMQNEMYYAEKGGGTFLNGNRVSVSETNKLSRSLLVTGFPYNIAQNPEGALDKFTKLIKLSRGMRRLGSAAIDFCYVAKGVFDGFWEVHLHPWDICAGKLLVEEAGGIVTDFRGAEIDFYSKQICCTNKLIHEEMIKVLGGR
jgi:myo-inositol-1(or 4)-monophosphatase